MVVYLSYTGIKHRIDYASRFEQHEPEHQAWAGPPLTYCNTFREYTVTTAAAIAYYDIGSELVASKTLIFFVDLYI